MGESVTLPARGAAIAADIIDSDAYQRIKVSWGVDGSAVDTSASNPLPVQHVASLVPRAADATVVPTGGTAVVVIGGPIKGGYVTNPASATAQGIDAAENLYLNPAAVPTASESDANGTTTLLEPGQNYDIPALAAGQYLRANCASNGHKFTAVVWP